MWWGGVVSPTFMYTYNTVHCTCIDATVVQFAYMVTCRTTPLTLASTYTIYRAKGKKEEEVE